MVLANGAPQGYKNQSPSILPYEYVLQQYSQQRHSLNSPERFGQSRRKNNYSTVTPKTGNQQTQRK